MKRLLDEDTVIESSPLSYLDRKVNEYHLVFHTLYGLVDVFPRDVIFYILGYYYILWSIPINAFTAHQDSYPSICKPSQCMSVLIHTWFDPVDTFEFHYITWVIEFEWDGSYIITLANNGSCLMEHDDDLSRTREQAYHTSRVIECMAAQYEGPIIAHISVDNELFRREMEKRFTGESYFVVHTYKTDPLWRTNTTLMDALFQFAKPCSGVFNPLPSWAHLGRFRDMVRDYECHIPLKAPYRLCYESDLENDETEPFLYPLLICLNYHKEKGIARQ